MTTMSTAVKSPLLRAFLSQILSRGLGDILQILDEGADQFDRPESECFMCFGRRDVFH